MLPLFGAIPGGPELLILLIVMVFMMGIPLVLAAGLFLLGRWSANRGSDANEEQLAALQERIDELEAQLEPVGSEPATGESGDGGADAESGSQSD